MSLNNLPWFATVSQTSTDPAVDPQSFLCCPRFSCPVWRAPQAVVPTSHLAVMPPSAPPQTPVTRVRSPCSWGTARPPCLNYCNCVHPPPPAPPHRALPWVLLSSSLLLPSYPPGCWSARKCPGNRPPHITWPSPSTGPPLACPSCFSLILKYFADPPGDWFVDTPKVDSRPLKRRKCAAQAITQIYFSSLMVFLWGDCHACLTLGKKVNISSLSQLTFQYCKGLLSILSRFAALVLLKFTLA